MSTWLDKGNAIRLIEFYKKYPAIAAYDLLNIDLYHVQRILLENMWFKNFVCIVASRGSGKTFLQAVYAALMAMLNPGHRIGFVSASFRQAKFMFQELERIYDRSPILREATAKAPVHGSDSWHLPFKPPSNFTRAGSWIEAVPLGKGDKIRGARFHTICIDEMGSVPEDIFKMVIKPMAATTADPMISVRKSQEEQKLVDKGLLKEGDLVKKADNKIIMTSSGNFRFNHLYYIYKEYRDQMQKENPKYYAARVPYSVLPKGFLSEAIIEEARTLSSFEFKMEFEAGFISDTDGVFKASLLNKQTSVLQTVELKGDPDFKYIMAVDPAREESAATAIIVIKLMPDGGVITYAKELFSTPFPKQASFIKGLCRKFNICSIHMDAGGGGKAIRDLLYEKREGKNDFAIIDHGDSNITREGLKILHMVNFSSEWISDANYNTLSILEHGNMWFPALPLLERSNDDVDTMYTLIDKTMKSQISSIVVTQTKTGKRHFDIPSTGEAKRIPTKGRKDLYSCFIMAGSALYQDLGFATDDNFDMEQHPILLGIVKPVHKRGKDNQRDSLNVPRHLKERFENRRFFK